MRGGGSAGGGAVGAVAVGTDVAGSPLASGVAAGSAGAPALTAAAPADVPVAGVAAAGPVRVSASGAGPDPTAGTLDALSDRPAWRAGRSAAAAPRALADPPANDGGTLDRRGVGVAARVDAAADTSATLVASTTAVPRERRRLGLIGSLPRR